MLEKEFKDDPQYIRVLCDDLVERKQRADLQDTLTKADIIYMAHAGTASKKGSNIFSRWRTKLVNKLLRLSGNDVPTVFDRIKEIEDKNAI